MALSPADISAHLPALKIAAFSELVRDDRLTDSSLICQFPFLW